MSEPSTETGGLCEACKHRNEIPYGNFDLLSSTRLPPMGLGSGKVPIDLGSLGEIAGRRHECSFCRLVMHIISFSWSLSIEELVASKSAVEFTLCNRLVGLITDPNMKEYHAEDFYFNKFQYANGRLEIECESEYAPPGCPHQFDIQAIDEGSGVKGLFDDAVLFTRRPRESMHRINYRLLKNWLSYCRSNHDDTCQPDKIGADTADVYLKYFRLIDVVKKKLVDAQPGDEYAALSYVWGKDSFLRLIRSRESDLYQEGSLGSQNNDVPKTIRDAMQVMEHLGLRYLWVDALCIMQDDRNEKPHVIGAMDLIYSRAELTIVAVSGTHANAGLSGIEPGVRDLAPFEVEASFPESSRTFRVARERPSMVIERSRWNSRGWTYQERLCSRRLLLFLEQQVIFVCGKASWCEDTVLETDNPRVYYEEQPLANLNLPNDETTSFMRSVKTDKAGSPIREYAKMVTTYTSRDLTYPGDILDAFTGALTRFQRSWAAKGIDVSFLFGLPTRWFHLALLWIPEDDSSDWKRRDAKCRLPSGLEVDFPSWSWMGWIGRMDAARRGRSVDSVRHSLDWFYVEPGSNDLRYIVTRGRTVEENTTQSDISDTSDTTREVWKPDGAPSTVTPAHLDQFDPVDLPGKLVCFTSTCFLSFVDRNRSFSNENNEFKFPGDHGMLVLDPNWAKARVGQQFEFIALSKLGKDFLNVMLVERRPNGIAYRVGVGQIGETHWMAANPRWQMVVLG
jgi:hypothetical protein